jgi:hypothetical protein
VWSRPWIEWTLASYWYAVSCEDGNGLETKTYVFVTCGCCNKIPQTEWITPQAFISHSSIGWEVQEKVLASLVPGEGSLLGFPSSYCALIRGERGKQREEEGRDELIETDRYKEIESSLASSLTGALILSWGLYPKTPPKPIYLPKGPT